MTLSKRLKQFKKPIPGQIKKTNFYILVGPPAIGKSTFTKSLPGKTLVICRDDVGQKIVSKYGLTYDDLFIYPPLESKIGDLIKGFEYFGEVIETLNVYIKKWAPLSYKKIHKLNDEIFDEMELLFKKSKNKEFDNIVIDMTNMTFRIRKDILTKVGNKVQFRFIAVEFDISDPQTKEIVKKASLKRREDDLKKGIKKTIPDSVFDRMFEEYESPTYAEGYDKIIKVNTIKNLKLMLNI